MSTCNWLDLQTLGSQPAMHKIFPITDSHYNLVGKRPTWETLPTQAATASLWAASKHASSILLVLPCTPWLHPSVARGVATKKSEKGANQAFPPPPLLPTWLSARWSPASATQPGQKEGRGACLPTCLPGFACLLACPSRAHPHMYAKGT